jgi:hypothetical protein
MYHATAQTQHKMHHRLVEEATLIHRVRVFEPITS